MADLEYLEGRDLDLSVRLGAMLAFNALLITIGTHPIAASPGAPLSVLADRQPLLTLACMIGLVPLVVSCALVLRALLHADRFEQQGGEDDATLRLRLMAGFVHTIDLQARLLDHAIRATLAGGIAMIAVWVAIIAIKMV